MNEIKIKDSKSKYLMKNTIIFAIGNFATKLISFLLVPLYTNVLTTEQFGTVDLLYTLCSFLIPFFSFNITEAVLRFSLDKNSKMNKIISIALICCIFMIATSLVMIPILNNFIEFSEYSVLFYIYLVTFGISQILLINLKGQEKLKLFSIGNFLYALFVSIFNIIFLLALDKGIKGYFVAYIIANVILCIYGFMYGNVSNSIKNFDFDKKLFFNMIKYSIVLIPTSFMWWIMNFLDRIMLTKYISLSANGLYAISYKIPTILSVVSSIFTQAWLFSAIKEKDSEDKETYTNKIFNFLSFGTIVLALVLLMILKPLFKVYVSSDFYESWKYVPLLMLGYIFLTLGTFVSTSYNVNKDSKGLLYSSLIGAILNTILNLFFIPIIGIYGAALATAISYISVFIFRIIDTKKYVSIKITKKFIYSIFLVTLMSLTLFIEESMIMPIISGMITIIFILLIYKKDWSPILNIILKKLKK